MSREHHESTASTEEQPIVSTDQADVDGLEQVETKEAEQPKVDDAGQTENEETESESNVKSNEMTDISLELLQKQIDASNERFHRVQADYDNFRRRTRQEREDFAKYASQKLLEGLLPIVDNFQRAIEAGKENKDYDALFKGVEIIFRQLMTVLEQEGLEQMDPVGQPFDPQFHEAIMQVSSELYEEGIVADVMQQGYLLKEKVLRPAMVNVSSGK